LNHLAEKNPQTPKTDAANFSQNSNR